MMILSFHSLPTKILGVVGTVRERHMAHSGDGGSLELQGETRPLSQSSWTSQRGFEAKKLLATT